MHRKKVEKMYKFGVGLASTKKARLCRAPRNSCYFADLDCLGEFLDAEVMQAIAHILH